MERIAPLAKILAEANGIDWQNLRGTGGGGQIVEADILAHLARIMSGEEEPPATPVDAPPPDWTGEDLSASLITPGLPSADALRGAGVDSDITAFVAQARTTPPAPTPALEDDALDFELDDDHSDFEPAPLAAPAAAVPAPAWNFNAPAPVTPPPPVAASVPSGPFLPAVAASTPAEPAHAEPVPVAATAAPAANAGLSAGLGGLLSRLYQPAAPAAQPTPEPVQPSVAREPVLPEPQSIPAFQAPAAPEPRLPEPLAFPLPDLHAQAPLSAPVAELPEPAPLPVVEPAPEVEPLVEEARPAPAQEAAPAPAFLPDAEASVPVQLADPAPAPRSSSSSSFGTYLRRDVNVSPAADLRRQLAGALGQDVPLGLLVARAAGRHAGALGLGTVALQDLPAGEARTVAPGTLRDALHSLGTLFGATPDLLVTDAGELDLDDLHLGHTVTLSVGRERDGRAALSLSGDVDPVQAARFLADVAGALEAPIILVI